MILEIAAINPQVFLSLVYESESKVLFFKSLTCKEFIICYLRVILVYCDTSEV